jgi:hypothetical protein
MNFDIDEAHITEVSVKETTSIYKNIPTDELTSDQLVRILKGNDLIFSHHSIDHPEFQQLRDKLEELGYIKTERSWCNGDIVLKKFTLNNKHVFKKGRRFLCAAALGFAIKCEASRGKNYVNSY